MSLLIANLKLIIGSEQLFKQQKSWFQPTIYASHAFRCQTREVAFFIHAWFSQLARTIGEQIFSALRQIRNRCDWLNLCYVNCKKNFSEKS